MSRPPAWRGPDPDDITAWTVVQAGHTVGRRFWAALADVGLTPVQFGVLLHLDRSPGLSNAELARTVYVTPQSMSELVGGLQREGLVERAANAGRGRPTPARLTAAGRRRLRRCERVITTVEQSLGLTAARARELNHLLGTVLRS